MKFSTPISILLAGVLISAGLYFGLKAETPPANKQVLGDVQAPPAAVEEPTIITTSIDDDAILGDKSTAQVAIIEFSDYECPYCKTFRDTTLQQLKEKYINTGEVILVYRDLPLSFHNPAAQMEAEATECARSLGTDQTYYDYHDLIFDNSPGNGAGVDEDGLVALATKLNLSSSAFRQCLTSGQFKDEVNADAAHAASVGISGTPGFVVGTLTQDGSVTGDFINGAQPYAAFELAINKYLSN